MHKMSTGNCAICKKSFLSFGSGAGVASQGGCVPKTAGGIEKNVRACYHSVGIQYSGRWILVRKTYIIERSADYVVKGKDCSHNRRHPGHWVRNREEISGERRKGGAVRLPRRDRSEGAGFLKGRKSGVGSVRRMAESCGRGRGCRRNQQDQGNLWKNRYSDKQRRYF